MIKSSRPPFPVWHAAVVLALLQITPPTWAQSKKRADDSPRGDPSVLTVQRIFGSSEFNGEKPPSTRWRKRGHEYVTLETSAGGPQLFAHDPATGRRALLVPDHWLIPAGESRPLVIEGYEFSPDESRLLIYTNSKRVWRVNSRGDYWVLDLSTRQLKKLGGDVPPSTMRFATFSPDGKRVAYVRENNLYVQDLLDFHVTALTRDGSATLINGTFDWVYEEELYLQKGFRWSPDSRSLAYWQLNSEGVKEFYLTNSADGPYPRLISIRYPKTGEKNSAARIGVVSAMEGPTRWLDIPGDPREHYLAKMEWTGAEIAVQQFNRLQNTNRVLLADPTTDKVRTPLTETDAAWVDNNNDFRWIDQGRQLVWLSERDGWRHAYLVSRSGQNVAQLTKGAFDVIRLETIDEQGGWLYFLASPDNPTQQYLYRVSLKGGAAVRVTPPDLPGTHTYSISADARWAVHTYSTFARPPVTTLIRLHEHQVEKTLVTNAALVKKLEHLLPVSTEFFRVRSDDGTMLDGWCIKPPKFDPIKKYPVLFHVYGEPAGQTVLDRWGGKHFLWHRMLAQEGYVVMSVDNRGTPAPRGRAWRKSIYRQVGILASADQAAAVRALLKDRPYLDPARVAIWGWSGGGSMTLNAIFRYPDLYRTALAVAPVPNQRHYDTIYQERYMGLPFDNVEGYRNGSPIHFARQLKGNLLIVHGTGDDNCHYLGVENLIDELIVHNKQFTMLAYPNRSHGISEGRNTTRHLFEALTAYLRTHNPPGTTGQDAIFAAGVGLKVEAEGGAGGEGPAWHPQLGVLTSGSGHIFQLDRKGQSRIWRENAGTNGLLFDNQGRLLACEPAKRRVTRTERDGKITVLADQFEGKRFNEPNDLAVDSHGRIYFSDPRYGPEAGKDLLDDQGRIIEGVYRIDPDGKVSRILGRELERPNGVLVSANDRYLFVADNNNNAVGGARKLWRFDLKADGTVDLTTKKLLHDWGKGRGPDGIKHDQQGRLYVAAGLNKPNPPFEPATDVKGGIYVLSSEGKLLDFLPVPRDEVTNCAFGGDDLKTLYITAGGTLSSIRTTTPGRVSYPR
jgi:dipeptidyl-peptidase-4